MRPGRPAGNRPPNHGDRTMATETASPATFLSPAALLEHWQGHRRLTRRVIEAFPEDQLFSFSIGACARSADGARDAEHGRADGAWHRDRGVEQGWSREPLPQAELLRRWDESTAELDALWPQIPAEQFQETITSFGQYTGTGALTCAVRDRQRDPPPRPGLRLPARAGHRAAAVLRARLRRRRPRRGRRPCDGSPAPRAKGAPVGPE